MRYTVSANWAWALQWCNNFGTGSYGMCNTGKTPSPTTLHSTLSLSLCTKHFLALTSQWLWSHCTKVMFPLCFVFFCFCHVESLDDQECSRWNHWNGALPVLNAQPDSDLKPFQTFTISSPAKRTNFRGQRWCCSNLTTKTSQVIQFNFHGIEFTSHLWTLVV